MPCEEDRQRLRRMKCGWIWISWDVDSVHLLKDEAGNVRWEHTVGASGARAGRGVALLGLGKGAMGFE